VQEFAAKTQTSKSNAGHFTRSMQTEARCTVNALVHLSKRARLRDIALLFRVARAFGAGEIRFPSGAMD